MAEASGEPELRLAIVVAVQEDVCAVRAQGRTREVAFAPFFPRLRVERVRPGNLVALRGPDGAEVVAWRWFDAVVVDDAPGRVRMWEPGHGEVVATPRRPDEVPAPGGRAYLSAGLPGAEWWVEGAVASLAEDAQVDLGQVVGFLRSNGLLDLLGEG